MTFLRDCGDAAAEHQLVADLHPLGVPEEGLPAPEVDALVQRRADLRLAIGTATFELGGDDAGVVEDEDVAGVQQAGQIAHAPVLIGRICPPHHQHPRRIARAHGAQRDPLLRQVEIEQVNLHAARP